MIKISRLAMKSSKSQMCDIRQFFKTKVDCANVNSIKIEKENQMPKRKIEDNLEEVKKIKLEDEAKISPKEKISKAKLTTKKESKNIKLEDNKKASSNAKSKPKKESKKSKNSELNEPLPELKKYEDLGEGPRPVPSTGKKYMGCHVSAASGIWNAFENAKKEVAKSFGCFLKSQRQWNAKPLEDATVKKWKEVGKDFPSHLVLPHGSYLMNLGSPKPDILEKSRNAFVDELQRCDKLGIPHYNFHPGSTLGMITRKECCERIAESINFAHKKTTSVICVIENMCKQGNTVGGDFHEIRHIIENVEDKTRVGVCLDTCHSHAAGYDLSSQKGFDIFLEDFGKIIGWQFLRALHINDSKGECGDHLDRHEFIGKGTIGIEGFRRIMNCAYFNDIPLILETPIKEEEGIYAKEIKLLEGLIEN